MKTYNLMYQTNKGSFNVFIEASNELEAIDTLLDSIEDYIIVIDVIK